ncbi:MAG: hypothetical protein QHH14_12710 [Clostridiales bacterium]|jgi:hypothetical protein|nr:hypothetical protein [Clostridiales bacterium]
MKAQKAASGEEADGQSQKKKESCRELISLDFFHGLFNQKEPEQKERQDKNRGGLAQEIFLAEEMPGQVSAQVKNYQKIDRAHGCL